MSSTRKLAESYAKANTAIQHKWFQRLVSFLDIDAGFKCLDIGCGTGINTAHLAEKVGKEGFVTGIDPDKNRINIAKKEYTQENINWIVGKSTSLPFLTGGYDLIISNAAMHWIEYEEKLSTYKKVFQTLKEGGVFANCEGASVPHNFATFLPLLSPELRQGFVRYFLTIEENEKIFKDLGFEILTMENVVHVDVCDSLDKFLYWSTATMNDKRIDFHQLYEENKDKLNIRMRKDGSVLSQFHLNYIIVRKK